MLEGGDKSWIAGLTATLAATITAIGAILVRGMGRRETTEERLQRWQSETVTRCQAENKLLRARLDQLEAQVRMLLNVEVAYSLTANALRERDPESPALAQAEAIMRVTLAAAPPAVMARKVREIDEATSASERFRRGDGAAPD